jgi:mono/diheme cytochrome c family protein
MKALFSLPLLLLVGMAPRAAADLPDYLRDIKPILAKNCYSCHGPEKQRSGLRLDTAAAAVKGGDSGPAIVPGNSKDSRLIKALTGADDVVQMPPKGEKLTAEQVALLKKWIDAGAKAPAGEVAETVNPKMRHWAFQPPVRPAEPAVKNAAWVRNPIDRFILARLEKEGIAPSPEADRATLIRRLSLDLTGLPPTVKEVDDFLADTRPDAYERLVDRLLGSPHYGERWGRHWLDLARYADSNGYSIDAARSIWPYRDWVINALNRNMPFDQFVTEQLAGDLLPNATTSQKVATGFHRNTQINQEGGIDLEQFRVESIVDRVNTTGAVFLGLTIGCAQCHDHKFDPISQREYYQLFAFLNNADEPTLELPSAEQLRQREQVKKRIVEVEQMLKVLDTTSPEKMEEWENNLTTELRQQLPAEVRRVLDLPPNGRTARQKQILTEAYRKWDEARHLTGLFGSGTTLAQLAYLNTALARNALDRELADLKRKTPPAPTTMVMQERKTPRQTYVMLGGDFTRKGVTVTPGVPAVLHPLSPPSEQRCEGEAVPNRLDLARWLVDPANPLTARVTVNRFWQHYFGLGLVETENDFGTQGTPPSHPELLDWFATEFIAKQWDVKAMHRLIVTSATYRQASRQRPELATLDPRNKLLARQARLRLEAEFVRDQALAASGLLNPAIGGPSVFPPQPDGIYRFTQIDKQWKASTGPDRYRRGLYTHFWRSAPHPALTVFDAPDAGATCTRRNRSNTPLQALTLLNDQGFFEYAQALAARVLKEAPPSDEGRLRYAFRLCLARQPSAVELNRLSRLLDQQRTAFAADPKKAEALLPAERPKGADAQQLAAWITIARVLMNLDEFITRE